MARTKGYGTDVRQGGRQTAVVMFLPVLLLLFSVSFVLAAEGGPPLLGAVSAEGGRASMKGALDRWVPVDEKTYPLVAGTVLKTDLGIMSIRMKDNTTIEMGKKTDLIVNGILSNYLMHLQLGSITFKVYPGVGLTVFTPSTTVVVQQASGRGVEKARYAFKDEVSGIITHDGKDTQVVCLRGRFGVTPVNAETQILTEGNRFTAADPQAASASQGALTTTPTTSSSAAPTPKVVAYESPATPELAATLKKVETGGLEVVSEKTP